MPRPPPTALRAPPSAHRAPHNTRPSWETRARGPLCWVPLWEKHKQRWAPRSLRPCVRGVRPFFRAAASYSGMVCLSAPLSVRAWSAVRCLSRLVSSRCLVVCVCLVLCASSPAVYLGSGVSGCLRPLFCAGVCAGVQKRVFWDSLSWPYPIARSALSPPLQLFSGTVCIIYKCFGIAARCRPGPLDQLNYTLLLCSALPVLLFPSLLVLLLFWPCVCVFAAPVVSLVARPFASLLSLPPLFSYI